MGLMTGLKRKLIAKLNITVPLLYIRTMSAIILLALLIEYDAIYPYRKCIVTKPPRVGVNV